MLRWSAADRPSANAPFRYRILPASGLGVGDGEAEALDVGAAVAVAGAVDGRRVGVATIDGNGVVQALRTAADAAPSWSSRRRLMRPWCSCIARLSSLAPFRRPAGQLVEQRLLTVEGLGEQEPAACWAQMISAVHARITVPS